MASYLDPDFHEAEFVGREEFFDGLDTAWKNNTRIFGIFGLRSVGKTRTAFEFIRRKREEYSDKKEDTKVQNKLSERDTDKSHRKCDEEKDVNQPGSRDSSRHLEYETDESQRKGDADKDDSKPDSKDSSNHSGYESNKSQRNYDADNELDKSDSEVPSKPLEYDADQSQRKYDEDKDDNQPGSKVSSNNLECETDLSKRKTGSKFKYIQREASVQACNLESKPKECDTNFDDKDSDSQAQEQRLDSETGELTRLDCAKCVYDSKENFTGKETDIDSPTRNGHANCVYESKDNFTSKVTDIDYSTRNGHANCVNESKNNVNSTESTVTDGKTLDGLTESFKHVSIREETNVKPLEVFYIDLHKYKNVGVFSSQVFAQFGTASKVRNVNDFIVQLVNIINKTNNKINVILFDNSEDAVEGRLDFSLQDIASTLVQRCKSVRIIITATTNARFAQVGKVFKIFELKPMTDIDSTKLLRCLTPNIEFKGDFDRIVTLCAGLPLALMMVAAELAAGTSSAEMVQMLAECRIKALSKETYPEDRRLDEVYKRFIERLSQIFQDRLAVLGYIPGSFNVWEAQEMLGHVTDAETKSETVIPLRARNYLQGAPSHSVDERRFDIHGVIRECLSLFFEIRNMPETRKLYCKTFVAVMKEISHQMGTRQYASAILRFSVEHPNLQQLLTDVFYSTEDTYHFYIQVVASCSDLIEKFMSSQGEKFYRACLNLATNSCREDDMITVYIALGSMQTNAKGEFSTGFHSYKEALSLAEKFPPRQSTAKVYQRLGFNMYLQGWGEDGLSYLKKSLEITSRLGRQDTEEFLSTMASLGIVYSFLGRYDEAEKCHLSILRRRKALQGENHPAIGKQLNNLGIMYEQKGDINTARQYFEEGLAKKKETKTEPVSIVNSLSNVARQCADLGDFEKAEALLKEALELLEEKKVNNVSAIGLINNSFGKVYLKKEDFKSAVRHMKESIRIKKTTMQSESSPFFVNPLILLARAYIGCENYGAAINRLNQVLALKDALIEKSPHNDLICQCYEEMLRVHSSLRNEKLIIETRNEMGTELFRLIKYFETKGNETKAVHFWRKLEALE